MKRDAIYILPFSHHCITIHFRSWYFVHLLDTVYISHFRCSHHVPIQTPFTYHPSYNTATKPRSGASTRIPCTVSLPSRAFLSAYGLSFHSVPRQNFRKSLSRTGSESEGRLCAAPSSPNEKTLLVQSSICFVHQSACHLQQELN